MSKNELVRYLKSVGFRLVKNGTRHALYSDGLNKVRIPYGSKLDRRLCKMILLEARGRMMSARPAVVRGSNGISA